MASNTSSISITKIAAATIPEGVSASCEQGRMLAERVVGKSIPLLSCFEASLILLRQAYTSSILYPLWYVPPGSRVLTDRTNNILQKLVELIAALQTSQSTLERARAYAVACGKGNHPITAFIAPNG